MPDEPRLLRFSPAERAVHRATGLLFAVCLLTAAALYVAPVAQLVGRRHVVETLHEWSGLLLPVPVLLGLWSQAFRADLRRIDRFTGQDRAWLASLRTTDPHRGRLAGKFNAGQKLWASWLAGAVLVMLGTGLLLWFKFALGFVPRAGVVLVHDIGAYALVIVVAGHVLKALADPEARRGMRTGAVRQSWAAREHALWLDEPPTWSPAQKSKSPIPPPP
ncbi:cytochrome b/b6 domain-containing protein [Promicromonospora sp. NPDC060271]|uniref:cytochrome b/b6 domain-containing protein n=1 Tax=Promicromonospora sp. NPDC060271 TaxID=3347089 RepID=UPI00364AF16A